MNNKDNLVDMYRGIASEHTLKKIFCKGIIRRIGPTVERALPPEQFGFRQGRGTLDAIHMLQAEVDRVLSEPGRSLYAVFIDCVKAFDRAPVDFLSRPFEMLVWEGSFCA